VNRYPVVRPDLENVFLDLYLDPERRGTLDDRLRVRSVAE
jgi:hypothetical protein